MPQPKKSTVRSANMLTGTLKKDQSSDKSISFRDALRKVLKASPVKKKKKKA